MKRVLASLSLRLFAWLAGIMAAVLGMYVLTNLRTLSKIWVDATYEYANQTSELIKRATHYGMLLNRKDDVHQTIRRLAQEPGIAGIRVYDKQGAIIFSADPREIGRRVDMKAEQCVLCHKESEPLHSVPASGRMRIYRESGRKVMGLINPIENEAGCSGSGCHAHAKSQTILGVLDVKMSMPGMDRTVAATRRDLIATGLVGVLLTAAAAALFIWRLVRVPVNRLIEGARRISAGDLDTRIPETDRSELGQLASAFNRMTRDLSQARQELREWSWQLESKVKEKTEELGRSQRQVLQIEKMASLGKLATTVAHELNNPLTGILNYSKLVARELGSGKHPEQSNAELQEYLKHIQHESARCGNIVRNLLAFAKRSSEETAEESLNQIVEHSLMVVRHHMEIAGVRPEFARLEGDDSLVCDANEIGQALVALFVNAVEAMPEGGTLTVACSPREEKVEIRVADTGVGIDADVLPQIFEPFFSTKEDTKGVGLGLAVVYGIVRRHGGRVEAASQPGKGTTFRIVLPRRPAAPKGGPQ